MFYREINYIVQLQNIQQLPAMSTEVTELNEK